MGRTTFDFKKFLIILSQSVDECQKHSKYITDRTFLWFFFNSWNLFPLHLTLNDSVWSYIIIHDYIWLCTTLHVSWLGMTYDFVRLWITINNSLWLVTLCDSFLLFMPLNYFVWLCMIIYNPLLHRMTTDYVWLCKTLLDTVWLCMTLYDSEWMNQFHKHCTFFTLVYY